MTETLAHATNRKFCKIHYYMTGYTDEMFLATKLCGTCRKAYYMGKYTTCETCRKCSTKNREETKEAIALCSKQGCKFKIKPCYLCGKKTTSKWIR